MSIVACAGAASRGGLRLFGFYKSVSLLSFWEPFVAVAMRARLNIFLVLQIALSKETYVNGYRFLTFENSPWVSPGSAHPYSLEYTTTISGTDYNSSFESVNGKTWPSFHLLIPASETNPNLCKTLLSAFLLNYPPPTLINFGKRVDRDNRGKGDYTGKIRGVWDYLEKEERIADGDIVLVIDGYDVWFQLPPEVMIKRYYRAISEANKRLKSKYGMTALGGGGRSGRAARFAETVVFAAGKLCWPNPKEDPACRSIPESTLPEDAWGPWTDKDPEGRLNRPRFLNSGSIIGPVADVKAVYGTAVTKAEDQESSAIGDQFVFSEIFGEQEYQREVVRQANRGTSGRLQEWFAGKLGLALGPKNGSTEINEMIAEEGQRYEFGIGLDYEAAMFQTMTHSHGDVEYLVYNDTVRLSAVQEEHRVWGVRHVLALPEDIASLRPPFPVANGFFQGNSTHRAKPLFPPNTLLDNTSWNGLSLSTNLHVPSVPALLHFNGERSYLQDWWPRMWYHSHARTLLQLYIRLPSGATAAQTAGMGGQKWWDMRGGKGGVWTDKGEWMSWEEICGGFEEEVFGDGRGSWGEDGGNRKVYNSWGKLVSGGDE
ncbi:hypothetical protein FGG08_006150 [Glutinoglossum americanum]|uniref:Uncharacterized protein n=1 Tax=Glutinoglossum americanum TaxID=1670608 RepID=A0A9P8I5U5_9PEZI|nr:hypothetical protein FGG08_006150 [Glutinoglossum americanum]